MSRRTTQTVIEPLGGAERTSGGLRQPNDRDESSTDADRPGEIAPVQKAQMETARRDAESPAQDTDCHNVPSEAGGCAQPRDPALLDDVLAPGDPRASDAENRRGEQHDPGKPAVRPDGSPAG